MRSVSLGRSRRRKRNNLRFLKPFIIFLAVTAGMLTALEERYKVLRIVNIETDPLATTITAENVWDKVPREAEGFWPLLWTSKRAYEASIEKDHPVRAELLLRGWGKYKLEVEFLQPRFRLYWENKYWYVSPEGKIWPAVLPDNKLMDLTGAQKRPVLVWDSENTTPFDAANAENGVNRSSLPVSLIDEWYGNIEFLGWTENIKSLNAERREGLNVVRLVINDGKGGEGPDILFPDEPERWREAGVAVKTIYPDITKVSSDIFIDMTYSGKIIVSNGKINKRPNKL